MPQYSGQKKTIRVRVARPLRKSSPLDARDELGLGGGYGLVLRESW